MSRNSKKRFARKRAIRRMERLIAAKAQADELYRQQREAEAQRESANGEAAT
jgi:hypothetical protein